jgi:hypothetical protein
MELGAGSKKSGELGARSWEEEERGVRRTFYSKLRAPRS